MTQEEYNTQAADHKFWFESQLDPDRTQGDFCGEDFNGVNMKNKEMMKALFAGASFDGCNMNWHSHDIISEILRQEAEFEEDEVKQLMAQSIAKAYNSCWVDFLNDMPADFVAWAQSVLTPYVNPGQIKIGVNG